uniref:VWFA domain-containing protein n=1 Tax=Strongyloides venezuelensis TaxID=75913 RepID=A0A0K0G4T9_STRVS
MLVFPRKYFTFIFFFQQIFVIEPYSSKNYIKGCSKQYSLFFCDKSMNAETDFDKQLAIIETYFNKNFVDNDEIYVSVVGEGLKMLTNGFNIVQPKDDNSLNDFIIQLIKIPYSQNNISYLNLTIKFYNHLKLVNKNIYTDYPTIIFFINSYLKDLQSTKALLEQIKNEKLNNVKMLAIIFDKKYFQNATYLAGDGNVYYFCEKSLYVGVTKWIFNKICVSLETSTITMPLSTTPSIYSTSTDIISTTQKIIPIDECKTYFSISIDTNSQFLDKSQFHFIKNVIQNNISSLITNYSKVSIDSFDIKYNRWFTFGEITSIQEFMMDIYMLKQRKISNFYLLTQRLNMLPIPSDWFISTYIFISQISKNEIDKSIDEAKILKSKGTLNFIIMGNDTLISDLNILQPSNIFLWNLTTSSINSLENFFNNSIACDDIV